MPEEQREEQMPSLRESQICFYWGLFSAFLHAFRFCTRNTVRGRLPVLLRLHTKMTSEEVEAAWKVLKWHQTAAGPRSCSVSRCPPFEGDSPACMQYRFKVFGRVQSAVWILQVIEKWFKRSSCTYPGISLDRYGGQRTDSRGSSVGKERKQDEPKEYR